MRNTGLFVGEQVGGASCFQPEKCVSRGEFMTMLVRTLGLEVDDSAANVKSAESVGYQAHLFTEPESFLDYLKQNNLIGE
jgi:hypothetical protein